jgi:hypothetical protein
MLGSLTFYRRILNENIFNRNATSASHDTKLPSVGHGIAGIMAGSTVSFIASPVEHIKARLQVQYSASKANRKYSGPIDCAKKIVRNPPPFKHLHCGILISSSIKAMAFAEYIMALGQRCSSGVSFSFGGDHMTFSPDY